MIGIGEGNLDDSVGRGTHWVVINIKRDKYMDSFGLNCQKEVIKVSNTLNLN